MYFISQAVTGGGMKQTADAIWWSIQNYIILLLKFYVSHKGPRLHQLVMPVKTVS